jgi:hemerythrin-like domain-containing protein
MTSDRLDPPAVVETRLVHEGQRRATSLLAAVVGGDAVPAYAAVELRDFVVASLEHNHRSEDDVLWPLLTSAAPELAEALDGLSREHVRLDAALDELGEVAIDGAGEQTATAAVVAVRDLVHEHLSHEEPVLLPALRDHITDEQWAAFSRRTVETPPQRHAPPRGVPGRGRHRRPGRDDPAAPAPQARGTLPTVRQQGRSALTALGAPRR